MINQSLHFEITGNDATRLIQACQQLGIQPAQAFQHFVAQLSANAEQKPVTTEPTTEPTTEQIRAKKLARAGGLAQYANPDLIPLEDQAVTMALKAKYGTH